MRSFRTPGLLFSGRDARPRSGGIGGVGAADPPIGLG